MWGHAPQCGCPICRSLSRVFELINLGSQQAPGTFVEFSAAKIRNLEGELRDELFRVGLPIAGGRPPPAEARGGAANPPKGLPLPVHFFPPGFSPLPGWTLPPAGGESHLVQKEGRTRKTVSQIERKGEVEDQPEEAGEARNLPEKKEAEKRGRVEQTTVQGCLDLHRIHPRGEITERTQGHHHAKQVKRDLNVVEGGLELCPACGEIKARTKELLNGQTNPAPRKDWKILRETMAPKRRMARPAAVVPERKRPARKVADPPAQKVTTPFKKLSEVEVPMILKLGDIWWKDAQYYHRPVEVAGRIVKLTTSESGQILLDFRVSGTKDDGLLREVSGRAGRLAVVHLCEPSCPETTTGEAFIHGRLFKEIDKTAEGWFTNMEGIEVEEEEDQLEKLRKALEEAKKREAKSPKREDKKAKRKERKSKEGEEPGERKEAKGREDLEVGQKDLDLVYGGTAMDPDEETRTRKLKKARKLGTSKKKKKKKSDSGKSGSSSGSSSSTSLSGGRGLFENERTMKNIWKKVPGALPAAALGEAREHLVTSAGTMWSVERGPLPPIFTQYGRTNLMPLMSPAMSQETLTLCVGLDYLVQGKVAGCADLLAQRLKSLESTSRSRGAHWQVSRQLELVRSELHGMTDEQEALEATKRARAEQRLRNLTGSAPQGGRDDRKYGAEGGKAKGKTNKGPGKQRSDETGKGRDGGKKDDKGGWQKRDERKWGTLLENQSVKIGPKEERKKEKAGPWKKKGWSKGLRKEKREVTSKEGRERSPHQKREAGKGMRRAGGAPKKVSRSMGVGWQTKTPKQSVSPRGGLWQKTPPNSLGRAM